MIDASNPVSDDDTEVSLPEAAQAVMDVLKDCHADLAALRHRMTRDELPEQLDLDEGELPSPTEQAQHIAARLEASAGSLRKAVDPEDEA